jgi:hypothetical protein
MKKMSLPIPPTAFNSPSSITYHDSNEELSSIIGKLEEFENFILEYTKAGLFILRGHGDYEVPMIMFIKNNITCIYLNPMQLQLIHNAVKRFEKDKINFEYNVLSYSCTREVKSKALMY